MDSAERGRNQILADAQLCYDIVNICLELGMDEIGLKLESDVRDAIKPFQRGRWVGNNGGRR